MGRVALIGLVVTAVVVFGTGYLLEREGRPYGAALLAVHKLVALAAAGAAGVIIYRAYQEHPFSLGTWVAVAAAAFLLVATFASGGLVSAQAEPAPWIGFAHRVSPWIATFGVIAALAIIGSVPEGDYSARFLRYETVNGDRIALVEPIDEPGELQTAYTDLELSRGTLVTVRYIGRSWDVPADDPEREIVSVGTAE